jgi:hypothetical protein
MIFNSVFSSSENSQCIYVYSKNQVKTINAICGQNEKLQEISVFHVIQMITFSLLLGNGVVYILSKLNNLHTLAHFDIEGAISYLYALELSTCIAFHFSCVVH